jgi:hypothetical protein
MYPGIRGSNEEESAGNRQLAADCGLTDIVCYARYFIIPYSSVSYFLFSLSTFAPLKIRREADHGG